MEPLQGIDNQDLKVAELRNLQERGWAMLTERRLLRLLIVLFALAGCKKPTEPDTEAPQVEVVYPVEGLDVFGVVEIRAVAKDTSGVDSVRFYVDDTPTPGGAVTRSPYLYPWDTRALAEGSSHTIRAKAWDKAGNSRDSDTVTVVVVSPLNYAVLSVHPTPLYASNLWVDGGFAYIADHGGGLQIVNISDPANPIQVASWDSLRSMWDICIQDDYAYIAEEEEGIVVLDISDPSNPFFAGGCESSHGGRAISVSASRAYLAAVGSDLQIFDISDPHSITLTAEYGVGKQAYDLWVSGDLLFVVVGDSIGLKVLDVSGSFPRLIGELATPNETKGIYVQGGYGYLADGGYGGLQVADLSDPREPRMIGSCATFGYAYGCFVSGRYVYVADGSGGLFVADVINPRYPSPIAHIDTYGFARGIFVGGDCAYIADGNGGMAVVSWSR